MPTHVYKPDNEPPTLTDIYFVHAAEFVVSALALVVSVIFAAHLAFEMLPFSRQNVELPWWIASGIWVFLGIGGHLALKGLVWRGKDLARGWVIERTGWLLQAAGWAVIFLYVLLTFSPSILWVVILAATAGFTVIGATRFFVLRRIEFRARVVQDQLNDERGGGGSVS